MIDSTTGQTLNAQNDTIKNVLEIISSLQDRLKHAEQKIMNLEDLGRSQTNSINNMIDTIETQRETITLLQDRMDGAANNIEQILKYGAVNHIEEVIKPRIKQAEEEIARQRKSNDVKWAKIETKTTGMVEGIKELRKRSNEHEQKLTGMDKPYSITRAVTNHMAHLERARAQNAADEFEPVDREHIIMNTDKLIELGKNAPDSLTRTLAGRLETRHKQLTSAGAANKQLREKCFRLRDKVNSMKEDLEE